MSTIADKLTTLFSPEELALLGEGRIQSAIEQALNVISSDMPRQVATVCEVNEGVVALPNDWSQGESTVLAIDYPVLMSEAANAACCDDLTTQIQELNERMDACGCEPGISYAAPTVTIACSESATQEYGLPVAGATYTATITLGSSPLTSVKWKSGAIVLADVTPLPTESVTLTYEFTSDIDTNFSVSIEVKDGKSTVLRTFAITFLYRIYWGRAGAMISSPEFGSTKLNGNQHSTFSFGANPNGDDTAYLWVCIPSVLPTLSAAIDFINPVNGLAAPFTGPDIIEQYNCYRSANKVNGSFDVKS